MVPPETVFAERLGDVLLLRVTGFDRNTAARLAEALQERDGRRHSRPPASSSTCAAIAAACCARRSAWPMSCCRQASSPTPRGAIRTPTTSGARQPGELARRLPVVVVVDGRTASAAEILAAALADRGRAVVVGSATLGKGLVQTIAPLPDGGELFVTWSRVLAPRGWPLQGLGVLPQVCTSLGEDALQRQLAALDQGDQPMADIARTAPPARRCRRRRCWRSAPRARRPRGATPTWRRRGC